MNRTAIGAAALSMLLLAPAAAEMNNIDIFTMTREKASPETVIAKGFRKDLSPDPIKPCSGFTISK